MLDSHDALKTVSIWDPSEWRCCGVVPTTFRLLGERARGVRPSDLPNSSGVVFQLRLEDHPGLLMFSARRGFPHLTLEKLHLLWNDQGIQVVGRKPHLLEGVLKAVCEWFLGPLSSEDWAEIQSRRRAVTQREMWHSVVDENPDLARDFCHEQDIPEVQKGCKTRASRPADARAEPDGAKSPKATGGGRDPCAAASSSEVPAPEKRRKILAPFEARFYTQAEAASILPQCKGSTISLVNNRTWQCKYLAREKPPRSHSVTYYEKPGECMEHARALAQVARWSWNVHHEELGLEPCPFDLDAMLGSA